MKKLVLLSGIFFLSFLSVAIGQKTTSRAYQQKNNHICEVRGDYHKNRKCKKIHHQKMKRMARADGKVTPRERKMLRNDRRRVY